MRRNLLVVLGGVLALVVVAAAGGGAWAMSQVGAYDESMGRAYDFPVPSLEYSTDPAVLERGQHLARSLGECIECHGVNMAGGRVEDNMGPLGKLVFPNVTRGKGARGEHYTAGEFVRLLRHGVKRNGHSLQIMTTPSWWAQEDLLAVASWVHSLPPVEGDPGVVEFSAMAKVLDRMDSIPIDQARRIDHGDLPPPPDPAPTVEYGSYVGRLCLGCHGANMSGGPIPGGPPGMPVPLNLTPHETGIKAWTRADFDKVIETGKRLDGRELAAFMPVGALRNMNETEREALWLYLRSLPPMPFGNR